MGTNDPSNSGNPVTWVRVTAVGVVQGSFPELLLSSLILAKKQRGSYGIW